MLELKPYSSAKMLSEKYVRANPDFD